MVESLESMKVTVHRPVSSLPDDQVPLDVLQNRFKTMKEFNFWNLEQDCRSFANMIILWREKELYKHFYSTWDEFLSDYIEKPQDWVDNVVNGVRLLDNSQPISTQDALQACIEKAKQNPIAEHGEIGKGRVKDRGYNITSKESRGTSQGYLARRLARDCPEILDKIGKDKEYKSVRAAAIAVGIIKPKSPLVIPAEPEVLAANLQTKCDADYLAEMIDHLGGIVPNGDTGGQIASKLYQKLDDAQLRELYLNLSDYLGSEF